MSKNIVTCEHGLRRRAVVCDPCRAKRKAQQLSREQLLARVRELEAGLAFYAEEANYRRPIDDWQSQEDSDIQLERGSLARAALAGEP